MFKSKEDIKRLVDIFCIRFDVDEENVCVGGGGALVMMGLRAATADLNVWVDDPDFSRIAEMQKVTNHVMTDTVVLCASDQIDGYLAGGASCTFAIRQRNRYFTSQVIDGVQVFEPLPLLIQKRGGFMEPERPLAKRQQDHRDIVLLNDLLKEKNKVRDIA